MIIFSYRWALTCTVRFPGACSFSLIHVCVCVLWALSKDCSSNCVIQNLMKCVFHALIGLLYLSERIRYQMTLTKNGNTDKLYPHLEPNEMVF